MTDEEAARRAPAWIALAELFLDTDVSLSYDWIAKELAATEFTIDELNRILFKEVAPALQSNLLSVAGEWAGWDPQWLVQHIRNYRSFLPVMVNVKDDWTVIAAKIVALRSVNQ